MAVPRHLRIRPVHPRGAELVFILQGDAALSRGSGSGGWQVIDRPRRSASTEWLDYSPLTMMLPLLLDGIDGQPFGSPRSIETDCKRLGSWETPLTGQVWPPALKVTGPVPHQGLEWVIQSLQWAGAIRHTTSGHRLQQTVSVTLLEFVPPHVVKTGRHKSPAKSAHLRQASSSNNNASTTRYTVKAGDTLRSIANSRLGDSSRWTEISTLNGIRDPSNLTVGQVLSLPS